MLPPLIALILSLVLPGWAAASPPAVVSRAESRLIAPLEAGPAPVAGPEAGSPSDACSSAMFEEYGPQTFACIVDTALQLAAQAPEAAVGSRLATLFASGPARDALHQHALAYLSALYGGPEPYTGPSLQAASQGMNVTAEQFYYLLGEVYAPALTRCKVSADDQSYCFMPPVASPGFAGQIIGH